MKSSMTGHYSALEIPAGVIQSLPKPVAAAWTKALTAQQEWRKTKTVLAEVQQMKEAAGSLDASVERGLRDKVEDALRDVVVAADEADTAELVFMARLHEHRHEMTEGYKLQAILELEEVNAALRTAMDSLEKFELTLSLWNWSRSKEDRVPPTNGASVYLRSHGAWAHALLQEISAEVDKEHPSTVQAAEDEYLREWLIANGKATRDGLVIDEAVRRAYAWQ